MQLFSPSGCWARSSAVPHDITGTMVVGVARGGTQDESPHLPKEHSLSQRLLPWEFSP